MREIAATSLFAVALAMHTFPCAAFTSIPSNTRADRARQCLWRSHHLSRRESSCTREGLHISSCGSRTSLASTRVRRRATGPRGEHKFDFTDASVEPAEAGLRSEREGEFGSQGQLAKCADVVSFQVSNEYLQRRQPLSARSQRREAEDHHANARQHGAKNYAERREIFATKELPEEESSSSVPRTYVGGDNVDGSGDDNPLGLWGSRGLLAGAAALYGTNFGCVKLLEESIPMSLAAVLRFSVAVIPFVPFLTKTKSDVLRAGCEIGALNAVGYWAQSQSLMTTTASKSAFICSLAVVLVPLLDSLFGSMSGKSGNDEADRKRAEESVGGIFASMNGPWFPALLATAGVACLELVGAQTGPNVGDLWALAQPLCFGLAFWRTEKLSRRYPGDTFGLVAALLLTVAVMAGGWCAFAGDLPLSLEELREAVFPASGSLKVAISLLWTGLITTSLTLFVEAFAMKQVSAAESTVILSTEPIWGTAFAAVLLGESIGWNTVLGAVLIVAACTWASVGSALQSKLLSLIAATGAAGIAAEGADVDMGLDLDLESIVDIVKNFVDEKLLS